MYSVDFLCKIRISDCMIVFIRENRMITEKLKDSKLYMRKNAKVIPAGEIFNGFFFVKIHSHLKWP